MGSEIGAAIHIQPNATRVLKKWDFDISRARLVEAQTGAFCRGDTLEAFSELRYGDVEERYGAKFYFAHRVDLHNELKLLATGDEGPGKKVVIELRKEVTGYVSFLLRGSEDRDADEDSIPRKELLY